MEPELDSYFKMYENQAFQSEQLRGVLFINGSIEKYIEISPSMPIKVYLHSQRSSLLFHVEPVPHCLPRQKSQTSLWCQLPQMTLEQQIAFHSNLSPLYILEHVSFKKNKNNLCMKVRSMVLQQNKVLFWRSLNITKIISLLSSEHSTIQKEIVISFHCSRVLQEIYNY